MNIVSVKLMSLLRARADPTSVLPVHRAQCHKRPGASEARLAVGLSVRFSIPKENLTWTTAFWDGCSKASLFLERLSYALVLNPAVHEVQQISWFYAISKSSALYFTLLENRKNHIFAVFDNSLQSSQSLFFFPNCLKHGKNCSFLFGRNISYSSLDPR